jgi:glycosyltransferase involved in cell wall biosynthesis
MKKNDIAIFQFLGEPCVRARKVISSFKNEKFTVQYFGVKRGKPKINALPTTYLGVPVARGSKLKLLALPIYILHGLYAFRKNRTKVVYCADLEAGLLGLLIKFFFQDITFVYDVYDTYADRYKVPKFVIYMLRKLETIVASRSDILMHVDQTRVGTLGSIGNALVVRNMPTHKDLDQIDFSNSRIYDGKLQLLISGGVFYHRGLKQILDAVKLYSETKGEVVLNIIGLIGNDEQKLIENHTEYVITHGEVSSAEALEYCFNSDVIFALYEPSTKINRLACPNKIYDSFSTGTFVMINEELYTASQYIDDPFVRFCKYYEVNTIVDSLSQISETLDFSPKNLRIKAKKWRGTFAWEEEFRPVIDCLKNRGISCD